jgi:hypothetical protein
MRAPTMLPLRGLQALQLQPARATESVGAARPTAAERFEQTLGTQTAAQDRISADEATIVRISPEAAELAGVGAEFAGMAAATGEAPGSAQAGTELVRPEDVGLTPTLVDPLNPPDEPFTPEVFGDESDENIGPSSKIGVPAPGASLSDSDVARFGAADDFGKDGVFQVFSEADAGTANSPDGVAAESAEAADAKAEAKVGSGENASDAELSDDELRLVAELVARDAEVRAHESAHQSAGGGLAGAASFTYTQGPDGQRYAVGGEVSIDASPGSTPQETITKAQRVRAAALAPASPSGQDRSVASSATQMESTARGELAAQNAAEAKAALESLNESEGEESAAPAAETGAVELSGLTPVELDESSLAAAGLATGGPTAGSGVVAADPIELEPTPAVTLNVAGGPLEAGTLLPGANDSSGLDALSPRGADIDLMALYEKVSGVAQSGDADVGLPEIQGYEPATVGGYSPAANAVFDPFTGRFEEPDETAERLGGRTSGFEGGSAFEAQLEGLGRTMDGAIRAVTDGQQLAYDLVA